MATVNRILLPLGPGIDQARLLVPATILGSWLDAPLQIVCTDDESVSEYQAMAAGLGVSVAPVLSVEAPLATGVAGLDDGSGSSLVVAEPSPEGRAIAAASTQPVFLVADDVRHRISLGPIATEITGRASDIDTLALTAALSKALEVSARLVISTGPDDLSEALSDAEARLRQMGCDVGVDALRSHGLSSLVLVGRTRGATAVVIGQDRLDEPDLVERATRQGVNVLVATGSQPQSVPAARSAPEDDAHDAAAMGAIPDVLDRQECLARLGRHSVARLGYLEEGWPTVVPVNYRLHGEDVFIRSLAGGKLRAAERGDTVCLELDDFDVQLRTGWSVLAHGTLEVIADPAVLREAWRNDPEPWVESDRWQWLRMQPFSLSGREVTPGTA